MWLARAIALRKYPSKFPRQGQCFIKRQSCLLTEQSNIEIRDVPEVGELQETRNVIPVPLVVEGAALTNVQSNSGAEGLNVQKSSMNPGLPEGLKVRKPDQAEKHEDAGLF